jgi:hypothetical protein
VLTKSNQRGERRPKNGWMPIVVLNCRAAAARGIARIKRAVAVHFLSLAQSLWRTVLLRLDCMRTCCNGRQRAKGWPRPVPTLFAVMAAQLVPFWYGQPWARNEYQWALHNDGRPDNLYSNGVFVSSEPGGSYCLDWFPVDCSSVKIGLIDTLNNHGWFSEGIIFGGAGLIGLASNAVEDFHAEDFRFASSVPNDIVSCVQNGDKVINLPWGESTGDPALSNACQYAAAHGVIICCAVPDTGQDIDVIPDYPSSWNFWNVLSATVVTRTGALCPFGIGASGTNVIGAPGRNVMSFLCKGSNIVYTTATSFACAHLTGIVAEVCALFPDKPAQDIVALVRASLLPSTNGIAGNLRMPVKPPHPALSLRMPLISVEDDTNYVYVLQSSLDLVNWQDVTNLPPLPGGSSVKLNQNQSGAYYRLRRF